MAKTLQHKESIDLSDAVAVKKKAMAGPARGKDYSKPSIGIQPADEEMSGNLPRRRMKQTR